MSTPTNALPVQVGSMTPSVATACTCGRLWLNRYENQRKFPFKGWTTPGKLDRFEWSDKNGECRVPRTKEGFSLPSDGWRWDGDWTIDTSGNVDRQGWEYAVNFNSSTWAPKVGGTSRGLDGAAHLPIHDLTRKWCSVGQEGMLDYVRRRRWYRRRVPSTASQASIALFGPPKHSVRCHPGQHRDSLVLTAPPPASTLSCVPMRSVTRLVSASASRTGRSRSC